MSTIIHIVVYVGLFIGMAFLFTKLHGREKKFHEQVRLEGKRYVAIIKDFVQVKGTTNRASLVMKLETPSGPVGQRLIVPVEGAVTWDFITTARVTERPVYVWCIIDPNVDPAVRQYGFLLEETPS
ncbi:hypothetical protein [Myxococcus virescens]|uniref:DUF3592 domain-containing protein n=1 Tax=Myxococcus virescens TaxID=83456 RepID=A0A511HQ04_9BACT|nr:hypothetical protein [Myxococcus virescens]GEL75682.1 hypothetical protein MVI01_74660 [Myxococcus virescens]SDF27276.1 hypothetical protein SAMN04488504_12738 [Myxococcus virescens]